MWTISQLKERGKQSFKKNYWRAVLVGLIIAVIGGSQNVNLGMNPGAFSSLFSGMQESLNDNDHHEYDYDDYYYNDNDVDYDDYEFHGDFDVSDGSEALLFGMAAGLGFFLVLLFFLIGIIGLLLKFFLFQPLQVGANRFFVMNLTEEGKIHSLGFAFDHNYKNQVSVMFFRWLYTFLWSLLCWIPGIYKSYEYRMIPYLLAEYPDMPKEQAFAISKEMMNGEKWKAFLLDLSFIGWNILNVFTCGILGVFFVGPYYNSTAAALYEALKGFKGIPGIMGPMWRTPEQPVNNAQNFGYQSYGYNNQPVVTPAPTVDVQAVVTPVPEENAQANVNPAPADGAQANVNPASAAGAQANENQAPTVDMSSDANSTPTHVVQMNTASSPDSQVIITPPPAQNEEPQVEEHKPTAQEIYGQKNETNEEE